VPWPLLESLASLTRRPGGPAFVFDLGGEFEDLEQRGLRRAHVDALIPAVSLFLTNRVSLHSYTGDASLTAGISRLRERGVRRGSVSDGENGLYLFTSAESGPPDIVHIPAIPTRVVDTTGAGDVLHAALIAAWLIDGRPAAAAGRFAAAAAALTCQGWGVQSSLPTRNQVETLVGDAQ
jgi:sugar/nucleoside kinase (ribokinase family)